MIIDVGPKPQDVTLSWENLFAYNRKILDPISERYFFVSDPIKLKVNNIPREIKARLPKHPEKTEMGFRQYTITPKGAEKTATFWIAKKDADSAEVGAAIRFMELFNVKIEKTGAGTIEASFANESYEEARRTKAKLIHWIPKGEEVDCRILMPDATMDEGFAESYCKKLKPNTVIQFERFGFVRLDQVGSSIAANYGHK
jgi:glutamyl-tRNA synthetase